jgi:hypothetical protein
MATNLATLGDVYRNAKTKADADADGTRPDWQKWLIIAAAVIGALMLMRALNRVCSMFVWLFWIWFWTHGAWRWIF